MHKFNIFKSVILIYCFVITAIILIQQQEIITKLEYLNKTQLEVLKNTNQQNINAPKSDNTTQEFTETVISRGILKKEKIPAELELGDYWYWLYFDEPYLLKDTATGYPQYINKIQVTPSAQVKLDDKLDIHIEVFSKKTWGYAESNIFEILAISKL